MWVIDWLRPDLGQVREAEAIMHYAARGGEEDLERIAAAIRDPIQGYSTRTQVEIDGVIERYRKGGVRMTGPYGPGPV